MRVTWLCSRKVEGQVFGFFTNKQTESDKYWFMKEWLVSMLRRSTFKS